MLHVRSMGTRTGTTNDSRRYNNGGIRRNKSAGADPGFWERGGLINIFTAGGGYGRGRASSRDSKGVLGER